MATPAFPGAASADEGTEDSLSEKSSDSSSSSSVPGPSLVSPAVVGRLDSTSARSAAAEAGNMSEVRGLPATE